MISIVIPTWNEESTLERLLEDLAGLGAGPGNDTGETPVPPARRVLGADPGNNSGETPVPPARRVLGADPGNNSGETPVPPARRVGGADEIWVADGGSSDRTPEIAQRYGRVVVTERNRGRQLNAGAERARGETLLFLHADVRFPRDGLEAVGRALEDPAVVGGTFSLRYAGKGIVSRVFTQVNRWRRAWGIFYGDMGIFVRREVFWRLGGFRPLPLLDDYEFGRRLVRAGKTICLPQTLEVSARRWEKGSLPRTLFAWVVIQGLYWLGVPPKRLARLYPAVREGTSRGRDRAQFLRSYRRG